MKIYKSEKEVTAPAREPGRYVTDGKTYLKFACEDGYIHCRELQLEGKKKMEVKEFLRGHRFSLKEGL